MRRLFALIRHWCTTEHGLCFLLILAAGLIAVTPLIAENAAPIYFPPTLGVPAVDALPLIDRELTPGYAAAHTVRSALYMEEIGQGDGSLLWDPGEFAGTPFLAEWEARALSPFSAPIGFSLPGGCASKYAARSCGASPDPPSCGSEAATSAAKAPSDRLSDCMARGVAMSR